MGIRSRAIRRQLGRAVLLGLLLSGCICPATRPQPPPPSEASPAAPAASINVASTSDGVPRAVVRQQNYWTEAGPYALEVDPTDGAKIVAFSLAGQSVIVSRQESPEAYGSSFWPSPQNDWRWPPPLELDKDPWKVSVDDHLLVLESRKNPKLELSATQRIRLDGERGAASMEFVLTNRGSAARRVAPWQNTRVRPGGLLFYPSSTPALPQSSLKLEPTGGIVWFRHDPAAFKESKKSYADGQEGWLALVDGDLLFVKVFPDVPRERIAPEEGEVVIYVHESGRFIEMEQQGPYAELGPGASSSWKVKWLVRRLPSGVSAEAGNQRLVEFVRGLVASVASV